MQLTDTDILITIAGVIFAVACAAAFAKYRRRRVRAADAELSRMDAHREWIRSVSTPPAETSGKHEIPEELLGGMTYRLSFDGRARAKVADPEPQP